MPDTSPTPVDLDALQKLADACTMSAPYSTDWYYIVGQVPDGRPGGEVVGDMRPSVTRLLTQDQQKRHAAYVVALLNAAPALIADLRSRASIGPDSERIRELKAENAQLRRLRDVGSCPCDCHDGSGPHCDTCCQKRPELCHDCRSDA